MGREAVCAQSSIGLLIVGALVQVYPIFFLLMNTFKTDTQILNTPFSLPSNFSLAAYIDIWTGDRTGMFFGRYFYNSVIVVSCHAGADAGHFESVRVCDGSRPVSGECDAAPGSATLSLAVPAHALAIPALLLYRRSWAEKQPSRANAGLCEQSALRSRLY